MTARNLVALARKARLKAYAPYSRFKVGAAVVGASGAVYTGCNVENASYGLCICAERTAVAKAISEGERSIREVAVATSGKKPGPPCGMCRQVLAEFGPPAMKVTMAGATGPTKTVTLGKLLPLPFTKRFL